MHIEVTMTQLEEIVCINLQAKRWQPIIILGAPGWNKTGFCEETLPRLYAEALGVDPDDIPVVTENPSRRDAAEIAGVAMPNKDANGNFVTKFSRSPVIQRILDTGASHGVLLWDELASAREPEQKVCRDSLHPKARFIGSNDPINMLPEGWIVVGTGNRAADKAGSFRLLSHITNAAMVFTIKQDVLGLVKYWNQAGLNPVAIECAEAHFDQGFFADKVPTEDGPYCTPRSLEEAAKHLDVIMADPDFTGYISPLHENLLAANIGQRSASLLTQWIAQRDQVPKAADILRDPDGARVPDQTGFQLIAANVAMGEVNDQHSATQVMHYILRLRTDLRVPLVAKLLRLCAREGWPITDPKASEFIAKHHELLPLAA